MIYSFEILKHKVKKGFKQEIENVIDYV
jgi:hypothetical protein